MRAIQPESLLKFAFLAGAVTDALAVVPLVWPRLAGVLWGQAFAAGTPGLVAGYAASLMLGWTVLLIWAFRSPVQRRSIAVLTILVLAGLVVTEVVAAARGDVSLGRLVPTWVLQAALASLFSLGYHATARPGHRA